MIYPTTIEEFLSALRHALRDCDPALIQDAVYDAEEYLRAAVAEHGDKSETDALIIAMKAFGTPDDVANEYRKMERTVQHAMRTPTPTKRNTVLGQIFGVYAEPQAYASLFYMLLSLATGIFYFVWVVTGLSLSAGLAILIFGIPFFLLFVASTRLISLIEGRIVETLLGERMPRRPMISSNEQGWWAKILNMLRDRRTWSTMLYMAAMMPIGVVYFTVAVTMTAVSLALLFAPVAKHFFNESIHIGSDWILSYEESFLMIPLGILGITLLLHVAKWIGRLHGQLSKHLLVAV
jgi:uncharacterized membrane protein